MKNLREIVKGGTGGPVDSSVVASTATISMVDWLTLTAIEINQANNLREYASEKSISAEFSSIELRLLLEDFKSGWTPRSNNTNNTKVNYSEKKILELTY